MLVPCEQLAPQLKTTPRAILLPATSGASCDDETDACGVMADGVQASHRECGHEADPARVVELLLAAHPAAAAVARADGMLPLHLLAQSWRELGQERAADVMRALLQTCPEAAARRSFSPLRFCSCSSAPRARVPPKRGLRLIPQNARRPV